jgi:hypothetical protein
VVRHRRRHRRLGALAMVQAFVAITQKGNQLVAASPSTSP